jgi:hypothetical protein
VVLHWFRIDYAENALRRSTDGLLPPTAAAATAALRAFHRDYRPQHATLPGADVLTARWFLDGDAFVLALERRMQRDHSDRPRVFVGFELRYPLTASRRALGSREAPLTDAPAVRGAPRSVTLSAGALPRI